MRLVSLLVILQLFSAVFILNISPKSNSAIQVRHTLKNVLGTSILVQDNPTETPTDTPTPEPTNPTDTPTPEQSQQPTDTPTPALETNPNQQTPTPGSSTEVSTTQEPPTDTPTPGESGQINPNLPVDQAEPIEGQPNPNEDLITNPENSVSYPQDISSDTIEKSQTEDSNLANKTGEVAANLLVDYATDKISDLNNNIKKDDFSTVSFLTQRLNSQIDQTQEILTTIPASAQIRLADKLRKFCKTADLSLKTQQLLVPEDLEQDIEIARGKCLNF